MKKHLALILAAACVLPVMAQGKIVNAAESKTVSEGDEAPITTFLRDMSVLQDMLKKHRISAEEEASTREAMVKALIKQIKGPMTGPEMNDALSHIHDLGERKTLSLAQVTSIRKQLLLARFACCSTQKEEK